MSSDKKIEEYRADGRNSDFFRGNSDLFRRTLEKN
jgi:hypothetical protein